MSKYNNFCLSDVFPLFWLVYIPVISTFHFDIQKNSVPKCPGGGKYNCWFFTFNNQDTDGIFFASFDLLQFSQLS